MSKRTERGKYGQINMAKVRALLRKDGQEKRSAFKTGNFDIVGFILKVAIACTIVALFVVFFGKFTGVYLAVKTDGVTNVTARTTELLTILYSAVILGMVIGGIGRIGRELFTADDMKLYAAMPLNAKTLFVAKLINIYLSQLIIAFVAVTTINLTFAAQTRADVAFYLLTPVVCILLPLITIAISAVLVMPFQMIKRFLRERYVVTFILVTAIFGALFWVYSIVLNGVKQLLLGDSIRWFFSERVMTAIRSVCGALYPARWFAEIVGGEDRVFGWLYLALLIAACTAISLLVIKSILVRALQSRNEGYSRSVIKTKSLKKIDGKFGALLKKEFLMIFRTPSYMFSYLSVAVIMPLMVYFCMDVSVSLIENLIGVNCNLELALFLTILFGTLTNVFCATNISRDGQMFYTIKALPLNYKTVFFSKIVFCMIVTAVSQIASAVLLAATGSVSFLNGIFLAVIGMLFSFVNIAVATRYDFNHASFSTEDDGEIKESSGTVSVVIIIGMVMSFAIGGMVFILKAFSQLNHTGLGYMTYLITAGLAITSVALSVFYLLFRLDDRYYEFTGGGI